MKTNQELAKMANHFNVEELEERLEFKPWIDEVKVGADVDCGGGVEIHVECTIPTHK